MTGLFVLLALVLAVVYLNDSWRSLERVRAVVRDVCARAGVQFLDNSVVQQRVRIERSKGRWGFTRLYRFEFATDGDRRHQGSITLWGRQVRLVSLDLPEGGRVIDELPIQRENQGSGGAP